MFSLKSKVSIFGKIFFSLTISVRSMGSCEKKFFKKWKKKSGKAQEPKIILTSSIKHPTVWQRKWKKIRAAIAQNQFKF